MLQNHAKDHTVYDRHLSSTYRPLHGYRWKIAYGDHSTAEGTVGLDNIKLGGIPIHEQAIELADELSSSFRQGVADGLLGLWVAMYLTPSCSMIADTIQGFRQA